MKWWPLILLLWVIPAEGQSVYVQGVSYHWDTFHYEHNNITPGAGIEVGDPVFIAFGAYRNSVRTLSSYAGVGYRRGWLWGGLVVATGYNRHRPDRRGNNPKGSMLVPIPLVGVDVPLTGRVSLRIMASAIVATTGLTIKFGKE